MQHRYLINRVFTIIILVFMVNTARAEVELYVAEYSGNYKRFKVTITQRLIQLGNSKYRIESKLNNFLGSALEYEEFEWKNDKIIPLNYFYQQKLMGIKRKRMIQFDWEKSQATSAYKNKTVTLGLSEGMLGPMSNQIAMRMDLINQTERFEYKFIKRGKVKYYQFERLDKGTQSRLTRTNDKSGRRSTLEFDSKRQYVMTLLQQKDKKANHILKLTHYQNHPSLDASPFQFFAKPSQK